MPLAFNAVELYIVTINEIPWTCAKEVCKALEYNKKTADHMKAFCSSENCNQKHQLIKFPTARNFMDWPRDLRKDDYYIIEKGMYELLFSSQQPKVKNFRRHCCSVMFPQIWRQLTNKMKEEHWQAITGCDNQVQALEFMNEEHQQEILSLNEEINDLKANRHIAHQGCFDNVLCFIKKSSGEIHPYYIIQSEYRELEKHKQWLKLCDPNMQVADECDDPNAIHWWCRF